MLYILHLQQEQAFFLLPVFTPPNHHAYFLHSSWPVNNNRHNEWLYLIVTSSNYTNMNPTIKSILSNDTPTTTTCLRVFPNNGDAVQSFMVITTISECQEKGTCSTSTYSVNTRAFSLHIRNNIGFLKITNKKYFHWWSKKHTNSTWAVYDTHHTLHNRS